MTKVRIGNDFVFAWAITRDGSPENFTGATEKKLLLKSVGTVTELTAYTITGNIITIEFTPTILTKMGFYVLEFSYTLPDLGFEDSDRKVKVDVDAFEVVPRTALASGIDELNVSSELALGFKGDKGKEVELQKSATHIQWRLEGGTWTDLVALSDLKGVDGINGTNGANGKEVELQKSPTHIQWRLDGGTWTDLVALVDLKGDKGDTGAAGADGTTISFGGTKQIPFTNPATNDFGYSSGLTYDDALKVSGANQTEIKRAGSSTNSTIGVLNLLAKTSADMIDGFGGSIDFAIEDTANVSNLIGRIAALRSGGADNSGRLVFLTRSGGSLTERMTILENGFTGLGTTNPQAFLQILPPASQGVTIGNLTYPSWLGNDGVYMTGAMYAIGGYIAGNNQSLRWGSSRAILEGFSDSSNSWIRLKTGIDGVGASTRLLITNSGDVGISTTSPTEKLHVKGSVLSEFKTKNTDPTTTDIPTGYTMLVKNTTSGTLKLWANDGGTLKSVTLS